MDRVESMRLVSSEREPLGLVWIDCAYPVVAAGLKEALEGRARVHLGRSTPAKNGVPACAILDAEGVEGLANGIERIRGVNPDMSVLQRYAMTLDLRALLAWYHVGPGVPVPSLPPPNVGVTEVAQLQ